MKWFSNLKIARKLTLAFAGLLLTLSGLGIFAIIQFINLHEPTTIIIADNLPAIELTAELGEDGAALRRFELGTLLVTDEARKQQYEKIGQEAISSMQKHMVELDHILTTSEERRLLQAVQSSMQDYLEKRRQSVALDAQGKHKEAVIYLTDQGQPAYDAFNTALNEIRKYNNMQASDSAKKSERIYSTSRTLVIGVIVFGIVLGVIIATVVSRKIAGPLRAMQAVAEKLALGDADQKITHESKDEIGLLANS